MAVRNWNNIAGGVWSDAGNWTQSAPPTDGTGDVVDFISGVYTSIVDVNFLPGVTSPSLLDINLNAPGVTLDVQRSITVTQIDGDLSANGTAGSDGLLEIGNGAVLTYNASVVNTTNGNPGVGLYVKGDGVGSIGTFFVTGAIDTGGTLIADHVNFDASGGIVDSTAMLTLKNGSSWTAQSAETFDVGTVRLAGSAVANFGALPSGALAFQGSATTDQQVVMSSTNNELVLPNTSDAKSLTITQFGLTDKIEIAGIANVQSATYDSSNDLNFFSGANGTGSVLAVLTGVTIAPGLSSTLNPTNFTIGTDATGTFVELVSCFTRGTRILTPDGEARVEDLREGCLVMTKVDDRIEARPVVWIGRREIDLTRHPHPWMAAPIRVRRGAVADNMPHRDLVLSPDHGIFIDGGLVPARFLVNGGSIVREFPKSIEYFHIECDSHAIILAEGLTVETYLDTGNRATFEAAGATMTLHPRFETDASAKSWDDACAPLMIEANIVEPIWQRLEARSANLGWRGAVRPAETTHDPDLRLSVNGCEVHAIRVVDGRHIFAVPHDAVEVTLLSRTFCPGLEQPWIDDQRRLGVAVQEIVFRGYGDCGNGDFRTMSADDAALNRGWWPAESNDEIGWRWSNGTGVIPLPFRTGLIEVRVEISAKYPVDELTPLATLAA